MPQFTAIGLGAPSLANYGGGIPSLGAFALASTGALGSNNPGALRGLSNVLLVSNLNEEVILESFLYLHISITRKKIGSLKVFCFLKAFSFLPPLQIS